MNRLKLAAAIALAISASSCATSKVNREAMSRVKRVGVVAVVIDRLAPQPSDEAVLRAVADRGAARVAELLGTRAEWELVPLTAFRDHPSYRALLEVRAEAPAETKKEDVKAALLALFKGGAKRDAMVSGNLLAELPRRSGTKYVAATAMPVLPWSAFDSSRDPGSGGFSSQKSGPAPEYPDDMRESSRAALGHLAGELGLDGVFVVYLKTAIHATVGVGVINGNRGLDTVRMKPTLILVAKDGTAVVDLGPQVIDSITTGRSAIPVYEATRLPGKQGWSQVLDLEEPSGKVNRELQALVDDAMPNLAGRLAKTLEAP